MYARLEKQGDPDARDAWGRELRVEPLPWLPDHKHYFVRSAGPDEQFDDGDDLIAYLEVRTRKIVGRAEPSLDKGSIELNIEHDRGPFNGLAAITGSVTDPSGAVVGGATVELRDVSSGKKRSTRANDAGQFNFSGLPAGDYRISLTAPGFTTTSFTFTL